MNKQQKKLQQDIAMAERRLTLKETYLPQLQASTIDDQLKQRYMAGIEHERQLIAQWSAQLTPTTVEQADTLIESIGMTDMAEDHEENELGHVYTLTDNSRIVVTSPTSFQFFGEE